GCWIARMREQIPNWYTKLAGNREFVDLVVARWKDKQAALGRLTDTSIAAWKRRLAGAAARNYARWLQWGTTTWPEAVDSLGNYLDQRRAWMNEAFDSPEQFALMCK
ncbi:MAG TPA: hypothetical protein VFP44_20125, partial [Usitatibacter sp.]|nr:hypothetical protein [Usitatibacter sp.]